MQWLWWKIISICKICTCSGSDEQSKQVRSARCAWPRTPYYVYTLPYGIPSIYPRVYHSSLPLYPSVCSWWPVPQITPLSNKKLARIISALPFPPFDYETWQESNQDKWMEPFCSCLLDTIHTLNQTHFRNVGMFHNDEHHLWEEGGASELHNVHTCATCRWARGGHTVGAVFKSAS